MCDRNHTAQVNKNTSSFSSKIRIKHQLETFLPWKFFRYKRLLVVAILLKMSHKDLSKHLNSYERKVIDGNFRYQAQNSSKNNLCSGCNKGRMNTAEFIKHIAENEDNHVPYPGYWECIICNQRRNNVKDMRYHVRYHHFCHQHSKVECKKHWYDQNVFSRDISAQFSCL